MFVDFVDFLQTFDVFQLPGPIWGFLSDAGMFYFGRGLLVRFSLVDWKTDFSILQGLLECFNIFFRFCWFLCLDIFFFRYIENQYVMTKNLQRVLLEVSIYRCYPHQDGGKTWFEISKMK